MTICSRNIYDNVCLPQLDGAQAGKNLSGEVIITIRITLKCNITIISIIIMMMMKLQVDEEKEEKDFYAAAADCPVVPEMGAMGLIG